MDDPVTIRPSVIRKAWQFLTSGWVAEVPKDLAPCEFECRVEQCDQGHWETCERRLRHVAAAKAGEAKPHNGGDAD